MPLILCVFSTERRIESSFRPREHFHSHLLTFDVPRITCERVQHHPTISHYRESVFMSLRPTVYSAMDILKGL
jgi:hypothetical protein